MGLIRQQNREQCWLLWHAYCTNESRPPAGRSPACMGARVYLLMQELQHWRRTSLFSVLRAGMTHLLLPAQIKRRPVTIAHSHLAVQIAALKECTFMHCTLLALSPQQHFSSRFIIIVIRHAFIKGQMQQAKATGPAWGAPWDYIFRELIGLGAAGQIDLSGASIVLARRINVKYRARKPKRETLVHLDFMYYKLILSKHGERSGIETCY